FRLVSWNFNRYRHSPFEYRGRNDRRKNRRAKLGVSRRQSERAEHQYGPSQWHCTADGSSLAHSFGGNLDSQREGRAGGRDQGPSRTIQGFRAPVVKETSAT